MTTADVDHFYGMPAWWLVVFLRTDRVDSRMDACKMDWMSAYSQNNMHGLHTFSDEASDILSHVLCPERYQDDEGRCCQVGTW